MATQTVTLGATDGSSYSVIVAYDDVTRLISTLTIQNPTTAALWLCATKIEDGTQIPATFPAGYSGVVDVSAYAMIWQDVNAPDPAHPPAPLTHGIQIAMRWPA